MSSEDERGKHDALLYRQVRQVCAFLLIAAVVLVVLADVVSPEYAVDPLVLAPILLAASGLLAVDLPGLRGGGR